MFIVENWGWPQYVFIAILLLGIGHSAARSGEETTYSSFSNSLIGTVLNTVILICGGFYQTISWPQVVWIVLIVIDLGFSYKVSGKKKQISILTTLIDDAIMMYLLIMGGFFV